MLDFLPTEPFIPWRILAADVIVGLTVALLGRRICRWLAARTGAGPTGRGWIIRQAWVGLVGGVLLCRGFYGPPVRMLLTAPHNRPAQRFADRLASSRELRAWEVRRTAALRADGETDDTLPKELAYERSELAREGVRRLDDGRLARRTELVARALAPLDSRACESILTGPPIEMENALARLTPPIRGAWFDLIFDATLAEIRGTPPPRQLSDAETAASLTDLRAAQVPPGLRAMPAIPTSESQSAWQLERCARERRLYATVSTWQGPDRATADRVLASLDADLTGELGDEPEK